MPPPAAAALPHDESGRIIVGSSTSGLPPGNEIRIVIDPNKSDPVTRRAACFLEVKRACFGASTFDPSCAAHIPVCASDAGGDGCCPAPCIQKFQTLVQSTDPLRAIEGSFIEGSCLAGYSAFIQDAHKRWWGHE